MRTPLIILSFALVYALYLYANHPHNTHSAAEAHVLETAVYSAAGAAVLNSVCALAAPSIDSEILPNDAFTSCMPFGLFGAFAFGRTHVFTTGGWGPQQWFYVRSWPRRIEKGAWDLVELAQERVGLRRSGTHLKGSKEEL